MKIELFGKIDMLDIVQASDEDLKLLLKWAQYELDEREDNEEILLTKTAR